MIKKKCEIPLSLKSVNAEMKNASKQTRKLPKKDS